ncbi:hypothetical protein BKA80DRAFT_259662 [Phyllosticta citrichinensis]
MWQHQLLSLLLLAWLCRPLLVRAVMVVVLVPLARGVPSFPILRPRPSWLQVQCQSLSRWLGPFCCWWDFVECGMTGLF